MKRPQLMNLTLRDGQQSTLDGADWIFEPRDYAKIIVASERAGFSGVEIAGGQSFQTAIGRGYNPFTVLGAVSHALRSHEGQVAKAGGSGGGGGRFELQMLFRGANALGFRHYDKDLLEVTLKEFVKQGITKIRCFDALNDIENLGLPDSLREFGRTEGLILEGAICFTHYAEAPERYSDAYFCEYARALIAAGYNAVAIKDMSGQLTAERVRTLVPALLEVLDGVPLSLHCHSTNAETSCAAIREAMTFNLAWIETAEGVLSGGSSHHPLSEVARECITDQEEYARLGRRISRLWGDSPERKDADIPQEVKEQLCAAGVPGGAMPFVIRDLRQQEPTIRAKYGASVHTPEESTLGDGFSATVDLFLGELKRVCVDAGLPLLVTPTADICCKQAIANLAFGADPYAEGLADRYLSRAGQPNPDPRFAKLILGYYGELKAYDEEGVVHGPTKDVVYFFQANNSQQLKKITQHPSGMPSGHDLSDAQQQAWNLIQRLGSQALSFASFDQLTILYGLKPASAMSNHDPIEAAVERYLARCELAKINGRGHTFPGYEMLMQPILNYLSTYSVINPGMEGADVLQFPVKGLGENLCSQLYDIYVDLPIWIQVTQLTNHLSKLLSSAHISEELLEAVGHVSMTLEQLDMRPALCDEGGAARALESFAQLSVAELFASLALINGYVNDVAKYATNPKFYAQRAIGLTELAEFIERVNAPERDAVDCPWEAHLQRSVSGKYLQLEGDFIRRAENWLA